MPSHRDDKQPTDKEVTQMRRSLRALSTLALTASLLGLAAPAVAAPSSPTPFPQGASHSAPAASWNCLIFWNNCRS